MGNSGKRDRGLNGKCGDTQIVVQGANASILSAVTPQHDLIISSSGNQIVGRHSYGGGLIDSVNVTGNTITLASPLTMALAVGDTLTINHTAYGPAGNTVNDPSVQAYIRYVNFLAQRIAAHGLTGRVEIWNEPIWTDDPWDGGLGCYYATLPTGVAPCQSPNAAFAKALLNVVPPSGVTFNWGGTHKTGFATVVGGVTGFLGMMPTQTQIVNSVASESFHPYGATPEAHAWSPPCLLSPTTSNIFQQCSLTGTVFGSNIKSEAQDSDKLLLQSGWTVERNITETGLYTANQAAKTRFYMRQYLTYHSLGMKRINFYRLIDGAANAVGWGVADPQTQAPFPVFTAMQSFLNSLKSFSVAPVNSSNVPTVSSYSGPWPLEVIPVVGRPSSGATDNTVFLMVWQRTYIPDSASNVAFENIPTPPAVNVTLQVPSSLHFTSATNLDTQASVATQTPSAGNLSLPVQDDPIVVRFDPN